MILHTCILLISNMRCMYVCTDTYCIFFSSTTKKKIYRPMYIEPKSVYTDLTNTI